MRVEFTQLLQNMIGDMEGNPNPIEVKILGFEYAHKLWEEQGLPLGEALVAVGKIGVRPILMTMLCALFSLFPLGLGLGCGAELQKPLATAVTGWLCLSTFVTLLLMPVLYSLIERKPL